VLKIVAGLANCFANAPKIAAIVYYADWFNAKKTYVNIKKVSTYITCSAVIQDDAKSVNLQHFYRNSDANTELSKSVCKTVSQSCGFCIEHGGSPFEQSFQSQ
jgi:hypothetical protein